ncbi:MAG: hypothetical protein KatS3mg105_0856 [Gemmatales bacterium]|nr:MAG: hypothetical protein KatS3mg105_0856 [Gemmatales bacterium]
MKPDRKNPGTSPGLAFEGDDQKEVIIESKNPLHRHTIRLVHDPDFSYTSWTALTITGGKVTLRNLRFEIDATFAPKIVMNAVKLQKYGQLVIENCEFVQFRPPAAADSRLGSVFIDGGKTTDVRPVATIRQCYFSRGDMVSKEPPGFLRAQEAITLANEASLHLENCAFAPHETIVSILSGAKANVTLANCSSFILAGNVLNVDEGASASIVVSRSIFSRPGRANLLRTAPAVFLVRPPKSSVRYQGTGNRFHNLTALQDGVEFIDDLQSFTAQNNFTSSQSLRLAHDPWFDHEPLRRLAENQPMLAFQLKTNDADLRFKEAGSERLVGIQYCSWGLCYGPLRPIDEFNLPAANQKIVDPDKEVGNGNYKLLAQALLEARPNDEILIKKSGPISFDPIYLARSAPKVTIRPFDENYHPILVLKPTVDPEAAMFRIIDSTITLSNLEFVLTADPENLSHRSLVQIVGRGACIFDRCVITIRDDNAEENTSRPAVVTISELRSEFDSMPQITMRHCFVRGNGELVSVRQSRPFRLSFQDSLAALGGALVGMDGHPKNEPALDPPVTINLTRSTFYLGGHLLFLRTNKSLRDLTPVQIKARFCLFAASKQNALIHLLGDMNEREPAAATKSLKARLVWVVDDLGNGNAYNNVKLYLDHQPKKDLMPSLMPYDEEKMGRLHSRKSHDCAVRPAALHSSFLRTGVPWGV